MRWDTFLKWMWMFCLPGHCPRGQYTFHLKDQTPSRLPERLGVCHQENATFIIFGQFNGS